MNSSTLPANNKKGILETVSNSLGLGKLFNSNTSTNTSTNSSAVPPSMGGRRRKSRKVSKKSRKARKGSKKSRKGRKGSRKH